MKTKLTLFFVLCLLSINLFSQDYFQQEINYTIEVRLDDKKNELFANETIQYINDSPDSLTVICMHLWVNAYKNNETSLCNQMLSYGNVSLFYNYGGYVDELDFKINEQDVKWSYFDDFIDICYIFLNEPILSGDTILITTPFHVAIPSNEISRMGYDANSYQISQFSKWKFKHPQPNDLHKHFQENANKNIVWFFNDVVKTTKTMDYSAVKIKDNKLLVQNKGELISPISITGFVKKEIIFEFWEDGFIDEKWIQLPEKQFDRIIINYNYNTLDLETTNNTVIKK